MALSAHISREMRDTIKRVNEQEQRIKARHQDRLRVVALMREGGGFASALAAVCDAGDEYDCQVVIDSWPSLWSYYERQLESTPPGSA